MFLSYVPSSITLSILEFILYIDSTIMSYISIIGIGALFSGCEQESTFLLQTLLLRIYKLLIQNSLEKRFAP